MVRRAAQKCLPRLRWPPLVVQSGEVRVQGPTEVTSHGAGGGPRLGLVAASRAPIARPATARDEFQRALDVGYGTTFASTTPRGWRRDTLEGYLHHIKRLARMERMRPGDGPRAVLESRLLAIAQVDQSERLAKALLSAVRLAEKMGWMPATVRTSDWNLVLAIARLKGGRTKDRRLCREAPRLLAPPSVVETGTSVLLLSMYAKPSSGQQSAACMSKESTTVTSIRSCGAIVLRNIKTSKTMRVA